MCPAVLDDALREYPEVQVCLKPFRVQWDLLGTEDPFEVIRALRQGVLDTLLIAYVHVQLWASSDDTVQVWASSDDTVPVCASVALTMELVNPDDGAHAHGSPRPAVHDTARVTVYPTKVRMDVVSSIRDASNIADAIRFLLSRESTAEISKDPMCFGLVTIADGAVLHRSGECHADWDTIMGHVRSCVKTIAGDEAWFVLISRDSRAHQVAHQIVCDSMEGLCIHDERRRVVGSFTVNEPKPVSPLSEEVDDHDIATFDLTGGSMPDFFLEQLRSDRNGFLEQHGTRAAKTLITMHRLRMRALAKSEAKPDARGQPTPT
jgi:hypothetical protein